MAALVLGGGNALGAYHGGVAEALTAHGVELDRVAGSSLGPACAALIAGDPRERRVPALRELWSRAARVDAAVPWLPRPLHAPFVLSGAAEARLLGRLRLFQPRFNLASQVRHADVVFAAQTRRTLRAMEQLWSQRADAGEGAATGSCDWMEREPPPEEELPLKGYAVSKTILDHRWAQGRRGTARAIALRRAEPPSGRGLRVHPPIRAAAAGGTTV